jgi:hypothetical protein
MERLLSELKQVYPDIDTPSSLPPAVPVANAIPIVIRRKHSPSHSTYDRHKA